MLDRGWRRDRLTLMAEKKIPPGGVPADDHRRQRCIRPLASPLLLLFLQEIISERHRFRRRNPRFPVVWRSKEQRMRTRRPAVNPSQST